MPDFRIVGASPPALEAYERLIYDHTLLANAPGIERLWEASQALLDEPPAVLSYPAGSWGPRAMHGLLAPRTWRLPFERCWRGPH